MRFARSGHDAVLLADGRVLVAGDILMRSEIWDPATDSWTTTPPFTEEIRGNIHLAVLQDGRVLAASPEYNASMPGTICYPGSSPSSLAEGSVSHRAPATIALIRWRRSADKTVPSPALPIDLGRRAHSAAASYRDLPRTNADCIRPGW